MSDIFNRLIPEMGRVVVCNRVWIPGHIGSDGLPRRETVLARRMSDKPWTISDDTSVNGWWHGVNEKEGHSWSDSTVESWQDIDLTSTPDTSAVEMVSELLDLAKTTRTKIINWQYRDDLVAKADKWLEGVKC